MGLTPAGGTVVVPFEESRLVAERKFEVSPLSPSVMFPCVEASVTWFACPYWSLVMLAVTPIPLSTTAATVTVTAS